MQLLYVFKLIPRKGTKTIQIHPLIKKPPIVFKLIPRKGTKTIPSSLETTPKGSPVFKLIPYKRSAVHPCGAEPSRFPLVRGRKLSTYCQNLGALFSIVFKLIPHVVFVMKKLNVIPIDVMKGNQPHL